MNTSIEFVLTQFMLLGVILALNNISRNNDVFHRKLLKQCEEIENLLQILIDK